MERVAVVFGGPSPEHDISILTGLQACRALLELGAQVEALYWSKSGEWFQVSPDLEAASFIEGVPRKADRLEFLAGPGGGFTGKRRKLEAAVFVNACHGGPGEDGTLQAAFDLSGLRYTGPNTAGAALTMDKLAFGGVAAAAGLRSLPRAPLSEGGPPGFPAPYIVKPRFGGSSIGIEVFEGYEDALARLRTSPPLWRDGAVIEPYLADSSDLNVAVRTYPGLQLSAIEAPVRRAGDTTIYSYQEKYLRGEGLVSAARELPAGIPEPMEKEIREAALRIASVAGIRSVARIDFLRRGTDVWINEVNSIPGALAWYLWIEPPISLGALLADMVAEASGSHARQFGTAGADGTALRAAGSIANKLG
jgi:D-alanine-D-alanine ligase